MGNQGSYSFDHRKSKTMNNYFTCMKLGVFKECGFGKWWVRKDIAMLGCDL